MRNPIKAIDHAFHPLDRLLSRGAHSIYGSFQESSASTKVQLGAIAFGGTLITGAVIIDAFGFGPALGNLYENGKERFMIKLGLHEVQEVQVAQVAQAAVAAAQVQVEVKG